MVFEFVDISDSRLPIAQLSVAHTSMELNSGVVFKIPASRYLVFWILSHSPYFAKQSFNFPLQVRNFFYCLRAQDVLRWVSLGALDTVYKTRTNSKGDCAKPS